jgi:hypothetical protein
VQEDDIEREAGGGHVARAYDLEPRDIDLIVEALRIYRERWDEYLPGMRQKEEAPPTQITPEEASDAVQRCDALISRLLD